MLLFFKLGFRNLFRNTRRSLIAAIAIGIGLASLILADGFWVGMLDNMIINVTDTFLGHGQIHQKDFQKSVSVENTISNLENVIKKLNGQENIVAYSSRVITMSLISSAEDSANVLLYGIDPKDEFKISKVEKRIIEGGSLEKDGDILIGHKQKKRLGVRLGDRIVVTMAQAHTGELVQELFRLKGVFSLGSDQMDEGVVFIKKSKAQSLLGLEGKVHEIAFRFKELSEVDNSVEFFQSLNSEQNIAESWKDLAPGVVSTIDMSTVSISILSTILLALVSLGILNTLFMSLYERLFEFGVLRSLGTRSRSLLLMILSEAAALSLLSMFFGIIIAIVIGGFWAKYGIDYAGVEFAEITFSDKIYFVFSVKQFVLYPILIFVFTLLVGLYPGIHATRITLADALKKSL
ncbi:MAG: ABC transporter permease [Bacteriovoracaceae bacterium]|nr:ABC transporter permease [Bacteriovoracaceae bacterium]